MWSPDNDFFILGAQDANKTVTFANGLELGRQSRMVRVTSGNSSTAVDGRMSGVISGSSGSLVKVGTGVLELSGTNTFGGGTVLAQGSLIGTNNSAFGTGAVNVGTTADTTSADMALELAFNGNSLSNALNFGSENSESVSTFRTTADVAVSGTLSVNRPIQRNVLLAAATGTTATYAATNNITGTGGLTLLGGGTLTLTGSNNYGSSTGTSAATLNGGTTLRNGTILMGNDSSLSNTNVELGDAVFVKSNVLYATTGASVLGVERAISYASNGRKGLGGAFVADGNGLFDGAVEDSAGALSGAGAFYNISATIDGHTFTDGEAATRNGGNSLILAHTGARILVKDEIAYPERNGLYEVIKVNADGTMNIARVVDFDNHDAASSMRYGTQVSVTSGTYAGQTFFMASPDVAAINGSGTDPSQWLSDEPNANVSLLANSSSVTAVTNNVDVNANGSGLSTIGANANVTGSITFSGNIKLQPKADGSVATKEIQLTSATNAANGVVFSGVISETMGTLGTLSLKKIGAGIVTLTGSNTYSGNTTVNGGTLQVGNVTALGFGGLQTTTTGTTTVNNGFTLDLNGTSTINEPIILNGTGMGGIGALINNSVSATAIDSGIAGATVAATGSGSGFSAAPTVVITGSGFGATATASLGLTTASFAINSGGASFVVGDVVSVTGGGGAGATFTVSSVSGGAITGLTSLTAGAGYTSAPTILTKVTGSGTGATINGNATNFTVGGLVMTNAGIGYTGTPTFTFNSVAATATATLSSVLLATNSSIGGSGDISINAVVSGTGAASLTKVGAGSLTLNGANTHTGDTVMVGGTLALGNVDALQNSTLDTGTAGAQTVTFAISGANTYNIGGLKGADDLEIDVNTISVGANNQSTSYTGILGGTGGLTKVGTGTLTLSGSNAYSGGTTVSTGTLHVSNTTGSATGTGAVTVSGTVTTITGAGTADDPYLRNGTGVAVLSGTGTAGGSITVGASPTLIGVIKPGGTAGAGNGTLTIGTTTSHNLTVTDLSQIQLGMTTSTQIDAGFTSGTALAYLDANGGIGGIPYTTIWGLSGGSNYDTLKVKGDITLGTGGATLATIAATEVGTGVYTSGMIFKLIDWNSVGTAGSGVGSVSGGGTFNSTTDFVLPTQGSTVSWDISAFTKYGVVVVTVVPEPSRLLLMFFGLAFLLLRRKRRS